MNHKKGFNKLNRNASHRKALLRNMATVLLKHERIVTTRAKALELRKTAEKLITRAKEDTVHNRRLVSQRLYDEAVVVKLFTDIAPRMKTRMGGYTRTLKLGFRAQDAAHMVVIELVDYKPSGEGKKRSQGEAQAKPKKAAPKEKAKAKTEKTAPKAPRTTKKAVKDASEQSGTDESGAEADK